MAIDFYGTDQETNNGGSVTADNISSSLRDGQIYEQSPSGLFVPQNDIRTVSNSPETPPSLPDEGQPLERRTDLPDDGERPPSANHIRFAGTPFETSENDTRGMGAWLGGAAKHYGGVAGAKISNQARKVGNAIAATPVGQGAIKAGTAVKGTARMMKGFADDKRAEASAFLNKAPQPIKNSAKSLANGAKTFGKGMANVGLTAGKAAGKTALRGVGAVAKAAPGAIIGLGAGIVGDDLSDIPKYTLAGAALSSAALSGSGGRIASAASSVASTYREGAYGTNAVVEQREKAYVKSDEWNDHYKYEFKHKDGSSLTKQELKAKKQQGAYYAARGIDGEDTIRAVKMEDKIKKELQEQPQAPSNVNDLARAQTARFMKIAKKYDAKELRDPEKVQNLTKSLQKELLNGGFEQKQAQAQAERAVRYIKESKGLKS